MIMLYDDDDDDDDYDDDDDDDDDQCGCDEVHDEKSKLRKYICLATCLHSYLPTCHHLTINLSTNLLVFQQCNSDTMAWYFDDQRGVSLYRIEGGQRCHHQQ